MRRGVPVKDRRKRRFGSNARGLASLAKSFEFFASASLARLFVISLAAHFLSKPAPLAKLAEASNRFLNRLAGTHP